MYNSAKNSVRAKGKWDALITSLALLATIIGLGALSIISFYQTMYAFNDLKDPSIVIASIPAGMWIPLFASLVSQYGQNLALYAKRRYGTDEKVFKIKTFVFKNNYWYLLAFGVTALIDATTNCIWYYNRTLGSDVIIVWKIAMYLFMISLVVVEEVLGIALQAFVSSLVDLKRIVAIERGQNEGFKRQETQNQSSFRPTEKKINNNNLGLGGANMFRPERNMSQSMKKQPRVEVENELDDEMADFFRQKNALAEQVRLQNKDD